jgi:hypothetical protein
MAAGSNAWQGLASGSGTSVLDPVRRLVGIRAQMSAALSNQNVGYEVLSQFGEYMGPFLAAGAYNFRRGWGLYVRTACRRDVVAAGEHQCVLGLDDVNVLPPVNGFQGFLADNSAANWRAMIRGQPGVNPVVEDVDLAISPTDLHALEFQIGVTTANLAYMSWVVDGAEAHRYEVAIGGFPAQASYALATSGYWNNRLRCGCEKRAASAAAVDWWSAVGSVLEYGFLYATE